MLLGNIQGEKNPRNKQGVTPLHYAAKFNHPKIAIIILENIEDKNPVTNSGLTPLHYASNYGNLKVVQALLETEVPLKQIHLQLFIDLFFSGSQK